MQTAFELLPTVSLTVLSPAEFEQPEAPLAPDLTVFDGYVPPDDLIPASSMLFIAPPSSTPLFSVTGTVEQPAPRKTDPDDPLLEGIAVSEIGIFDAAAIALPDWAKLSISGDTGEDAFPLLFYGSAQGRKVAVLAFQLQRSDLPLQVAFPLLVVNLTNWLAPSQLGGGSDEAALATFSFSVPQNVNQATVVTPGGETLRQTPDENGLVVIGDAQPGIYQVRWGEDFSTLAALNFFSDVESDIKPVGQLDVSGLGGSEQNLSANQSKQIFWRPIAFAALALLVAEWLVYHRGTLTKIWLGLAPKERA